MPYQPKPGQFALFKNDKGDNPARPDYTGDGLDLNGKPIKIAAWIKQGKNGKFMACNIQLKTQGEPQTNKQDDGGLADMPNDLPF